MSDTQEITPLFYDPRRLQIFESFVADLEAVSSIKDLLFVLSRPGKKNPLKQDGPWRIGNKHEAKAHISNGGNVGINTLTIPNIVIVDIDAKLGAEWIQGLFDKYNVDVTTLAVRECIEGWYKSSSQYYFRISDTMLQELNSKKPGKNIKINGIVVGDFFHQWIGQFQVITPAGIRVFNAEKDTEMFEPFFYTWASVDGIPLIEDALLREIAMTTRGSTSSPSGKDTHGFTAPKISKRNHIADFKAGMLAEATAKNGTVSRSDYLLKASLYAASYLVKQHRRRPFHELQEDHLEILTAVNNVLTHRIDDNGNVVKAPSLKWSDDEVRTDSVKILTEAYNGSAESEESEDMPKHALAALQALGEDKAAPQAFTNRLIVRFDKNTQCFWLYDTTKGIYVRDNTQSNSDVFDALNDAWAERGLDQYKYCKESFQKEVLGFLRREKSITVDRKYDGLMATKSGILDLRKYMEMLHTGGDWTTAIQPASPDIFVIHYLDLEIDGDARAKPFEEFIKNGTGGSESAYKNILAHFGLSFIPDMVQKSRKMVMLIGAKRTGKSILADIFTHALVGDDKQNILASHVAMADWSEKFARSQMEFSLWNTDAEYEKFTGSVAIAKKVAAGDAIQIELKFKAPYNTAISARQFLCSNIIPESHNDGFGLADRWMLIDWSKPADAVEDIYLKDKLCQYRMGIINISLIEAAEWIQRGGWLEADLIQQDIVEKTREQNPMYAFLRQYGKYDPDCWTFSTVFFNCYKAFLRQQGNAQPKNNTIDGMLRNMIRDGNNLPESVHGIAPIAQRRLMFGGSEHKRDGIMGLKIVADTELRGAIKDYLPEHTKVAHDTLVEQQKNIWSDMRKANQEKRKRAEAAAQEVSNRCEDSLIDDDYDGMLPESMFELDDVTFDLSDPHHLVGGK